MKRTVLAALFAATIAISAFADQADQDEMPNMPVMMDGIDELTEERAEQIIGSINPLDNDLRGLEVAIRLNDGFRIKEDGAIFNLGVVDGAGITRIDETFTLTETFSVEAPTLSEAARDSFSIRTFKLDETDFDRMHASDLVLQEIKRTSTGDNQLTFNAGAYSCANPDMETPDEYRLALFVRTASNVDFVPLTAGDMVTQRENSGILATVWDDCTD